MDRWEGGSVWDAWERPSCTRLKDLDSVGMEKFDYIFDGVLCNGRLPAETCKVSGFQ